MKRYKWLIERSPNRAFLREELFRGSESQALLIASDRLPPS
ncbi:MAG: hypothetical protein PUP91_18350 [Rhizonema sp. PD37]|nr:hypothetical protein [Rhizonema sp. PD37]